MTFEVKIYTPEEIDIFLSGDRREVDRLLLTGLNNIAGVLIPHVAKEEGVFEALGDVDVIRTRSAWIEAQIKKQEKRNQMMQKVTESTMAWALILFIGFIAYSVWDHVMDVVKTHQAGKK